MEDLRKSKPFKGSGYMAGDTIHVDIEFLLDEKPAREVLALLDEPEWKKDIMFKCCPYTVTTSRAMLDLINTVECIIVNDIPGDMVECGVFMGGSSMIMAEVLKHLGSTRTVWLFDTFDGVPMPDEKDLTFDGDSLKDWYIAERVDTDNKSCWCYTALDTVKFNFAKCDYSHVQFIEGKVEDTIPSNGPKLISLLRVDVDLVNPTRHVLDEFYPRISTSGHLVLDDYGHFPKIKETVDDYFKDERAEEIQIDYTVRRIVK